jgi:hypothetical protein
MEARWAQNFLSFFLETGLGSEFQDARWAGVNNVRARQVKVHSMPVDNLGSF